MTATRTEAGAIESGGQWLDGGHSIAAQGEGLIS